MKWTKDETDFLKNSYDKLGVVECAKALDRSVGSVVAKVKRCKLRLNSNGVWLESEVDFMINHYEKFGVDYCMDKLNFNRLRILSKAYHLGLRTNIRIKGESNNKCKVDFELFKPENMLKESAYILGLLWADGHVGKRGKKTSISCVQSDIEDVIPVFLKTGDWLISNPLKKYFNNNEVKTQKMVHTTTWGLYEILNDYGFLNKSYGSPLAMINKIPSDLKKYWYRGFLDGDGCIRLGKKYGASIVFSGSYNQDWTFLEELCGFLKIHALIDRRKVKLGGYSHFTIYRKKDVNVLCDYLYCDYDNIGFSRKYEKYLAVCERFDSNQHIFWSDDDTTWLKNNYYKLGGLTCAKILNKTLISIYNKVRTF